MKKIKVILRPSSPALKIVVIILIVFSTAALIALGWVRQGIREQTDRMRQEAAAMEEENQDLQDRIDNLDSVQSVQQIAQEELGLVNPDTIIINPES